LISSTWFRKKEEKSRFDAAHDINEKKYRKKNIHTEKFQQYSVILNIFSVNQTLKRFKLIFLNLK